MHAPIRLYRDALSGHSHRAQPGLSLLHLRYELVDVDLATDEHKRPQFVRLNLFGLVPVIDDAGAVVNDSNAILVYLATRYDRQWQWVPAEATALGAVQAWLSVAAGPLAYDPARPGLSLYFGARLDPQAAVQRSHALLTVLEGVLAQAAFLVDGRATLAEVALYSYVANAPRVTWICPLSPSVHAWLARIEALPGFVPFQKSVVGLRAAA